MNSSAGERSRGWLPIGLSHQGMNEMADTADVLSGIEGVDGLHCSDLPRAVQSAHEVGRTLGMEIQPTPELRDWNVGDLAGQPISQILPLTHHLIDNPDTPAPGGESYNQFVDRAVPFLDKLINSPERHIAVTHNRVMTLLQSMIQTGGSHPDPNVLKGKGPVEPSGVMVVGPGWEHLDTHKPVSG